LPTSPAAKASSAKPLGTGHWAFRIRLYSGLVLFAFVATYYLDHALGLISFEVMEAGRLWFIAFWRFPPLEIVLAFSLVAYAMLALVKAARSRTFKMSPWEWAQLALGLLLLLPFLMAEHILGTRGLSLRDGLNGTYAWTLWALWPANAIPQTIALFAVWAQGCIGVHFWLRLKECYSPLAPWLLGFAVLWPVLAFLGFADSGQMVAALAAERGWVSDLLFDVGFPGREAGTWVREVGEQAAIGAGVVIAAAAAWRTVAWQRAKRLAGITIRYSDGQKVSIGEGVSILEASRLADIPHASVCGGRGRCSTCRVRVSEGLADLPPADEGELKVLARVNAPAGVRLACQLRPTKDARNRAEHESGAEREIAIMFVDIRAFRKLFEDELPFDIVFLLNQYIRYMGAAIEDNGGRLDKFIGDGIMALFRIENGPSLGARQALAATARMSEVLGDLNATLASDLAEPLRIGVGVHIGAVIVGEMGYSATRSISAIGDAVNVASRLEPMTKEYKAEAIISDEVFLKAGAPGTGLKRDTVQVRGRDAPLDVVVLMEGKELRTHLEATGAEG
jgi:adenylate cyclase